MEDVSGFYREQLRPFGCGTAHRPFPTVSLRSVFYEPTHSENVRFTAPPGAYAASILRLDGFESLAPSEQQSREHLFSRLCYILYGKNHG